MLPLQPVHLYNINHYLVDAHAADRSLYFLAVLMSPRANTFGLKQKMIRRKKNVKKGIQFCLMVCGASGTGMHELHGITTLK